MSDPPENPVLDCLRRIDGKLDALREAVTDIQERLEFLEGQVLSEMARRSPSTP